jgi:hypothetical protein
MLFFDIFPPPVLYDARPVPTKDNDSFWANDYFATL